MNAYDTALAAYVFDPAIFDLVREVDFYAAAECGEVEEIGPVPAAEDWDWTDWDPNSQMAEAQ